MRTILVSVLLSALVSCTKPSEPGSVDSIYVLYDLTDDLSQTSSLSAAYLKSSLSCFHGEYTHGAMLTITAITDQRFTKTVTVYLPAVGRLSSNEIDRKEDIRRFGKSIDSLVTAFKGMRRGCPQSYVFAQVSKALHDLSQAKTAGAKKLILLTDGEDNNKTFTCCADSGMVVKEHPDTIKSVFRTQYPLPASLAGIEILQVHQPQAGKKDDEYLYISQSLTSLFTSLGATVTVKQSL